MLIDFTPGAGMMIKASLASYLKVIAVAHNKHHADALKSIIVEYVTQQILAGASGFSPAQKDEELAALKPARLKKWETQQKRPADPNVESPTKKRAANVISRIDDVLANAGLTPSPPKTPKAPTPSSKPPVGAPTPSSSSKGPPESGGEGGEGEADLANLMNQWA